MIGPICDRCHQELTEYGAILFGPPDEFDRVTKRHLCVGCFHDLLTFIG